MRGGITPWPSAVNRTRASFSRRSGVHEAKIDMARASGSVGERRGELQQEDRTNFDERGVVNTLISRTRVDPRSFVGSLSLFSFCICIKTSHALSDRSLSRIRADQSNLSVRSARAVMAWRQAALISDNRYSYATNGLVDFSCTRAQSPRELPSLPVSWRCSPPLPFPTDPLPSRSVSRRRS